MAQQTAVEWLIVQLPIDVKMELGFELIEQAKQMDKEQIIKAYNQDLYCGLSGDKKFDDGEHYYNETYGTRLQNETN